jgi:hypothetical protein
LVNFTPTLTADRTRIQYISKASFCIEIWQTGVPTEEADFPVCHIKERTTLQIASDSSSDETNAPGFVLTQRCRD